MNFVEYIQQNDRFAIVNKVELVQLTQEFALAKAPITPDCLNADGVAQGGFIFTLADLCFTFLSNHLHPRTVTQTANATYLAPAKGQWLWAKATQTACTRRNNVVSVCVTDDQNNTIALFQFNGFISPLDK